MTERLRISVVIPTIEGREAHLDRCLSAYHDTCPPGVKLEVIVVRDKPACGLAWNEGARRATGHYLHFSADDLEPLPGWLDAALESSTLGLIPAPRLVAPDFALQSCGDTSRRVEHDDGWHAPYSAVPFLRMEWWPRIGPSLPIHYFTDNWLSFAARRIGIEAVVNRRYSFIHHQAQEGRGGADSDATRLFNDRLEFERAVCRAERKSWRQ